MSRPSTTALLRRTAMATLLALSAATLPAAAQDSAPALNVDNAAFADMQVAAGPAEDVNDPFEPVNRAVFWVNEGLDVVLIRPAAKVYRTVLPTPVQKGVRNVLRNLRSPLDLTNQLLQGDWHGAGDVLRRFTINTTIGLGGLIDVAADHGMPYEYESLDQTLAVWGLPEGPYLVLPLVGSSSVRDAAGFAGEYFADPVSNYASNTDRDWITYTRATLTVLDTRAEYIEALDDVKRNSFDYYASMRSLYRQRRDGWIRDGKPNVEQMPDIPDYQ
ncbi:VacJ family lipoprotein [Niveispirillum sp.]|uniref:MlaA family lipoprotein n=1 Tax=Niveispirillum sp. TaxID=1917217 RepID=UPI001B7B736D|nr:VacJ family lipoprotein [Niveispirillum sp.]MBP7336839.1 VacJ family lipoprotein [Niveispirillum sp.]